MEVSLNTFPHTSTGYSPHEVVYGTKVNLPIDVSLGNTSVPEAGDVMHSLQECW